MSKIRITSITQESQTIGCRREEIVRINLSNGLTAGGAQLVDFITLEPEMFKETIKQATDRAKEQALMHAFNFILEHFSSDKQ